MNPNKIALVVASLLCVCLGLFLAGGSVVRQDYFMLALVGAVLARSV